MSKIGKISISIPEKVKVILSGDMINIEGPLGKKTLNIDLDIFDLNINDGKEVSINMSDVDADFAKIDYKNKRHEAYPDWKTQMDMQYWDAINGTTKWKDLITKIKSDNPKPS